MTESINSRAVMSKVTLRLIPFMFLLYLVAYLDRANASFVRKEMQDVLHATYAQWANAFGLFFWGYFLLEIPSNLIMEKVGARRWMARIMITWGFIAAATLFVTSITWFGSIRVLLGMAEAGFFPGMILYLTYWYPARERAKVVGIFMSATTLAGIVGAVVAGQCRLHLNGVAGLAAWQWLFLLEGIPAVILGFVVLAYLPDGPRDAKWLSPAEKEWLISRLAPDREKSKHRHDSLWPALRSGKVWLLCAIYLCSSTGSYGFVAWLKDLLSGAYKGLPDWQVTTLTALPYLAGGIGLILIGWHSDRTGERRGHVALPSFWAAAMLGLAAYLIGPGHAVVSAKLLAPLTLGALSLAAVGMWGMLAPFWTLPPSFLAGTAAAGGIALINSVGNLGGSLGPVTIGKVKDLTHSFSGGMVAMAVAYLLLGGLTLMVRLPARAETPELPAAEIGLKTVA